MRGGGVWERCKDCGKDRGDRDRGQGVRKVELQKEEKEEWMRATRIRDKCRR